MITIPLTNVKTKLAKLFTPVLLALMGGKDAEIKPGVFLRLEGPLDFSIKVNKENIEITFKGICPIINAGKDLMGMHFSKDGVLRKVSIAKDGISISLDGLPDIFLRADS